MAKPSEVTPGMRFGQLTLLKQVKGPRRGRYFECRCSCGNITFAYAGHLRAGERVSCGCVVGGQKNRKHGMSHSPEYKAWDNARHRCNNSNDPKFPLYGGRGITMCEAWAESFAAFFADMGRRPGPGYSLDRIDSNGGYNKDNCRWATLTQQNNNRSFNRHVVLDGQRMTVAEASRATGVNQATICSRLDAGKTDTEACNA